MPPKDIIMMREQLILQKRRQARGVQEDVVPPRKQDSQSLNYGRPTRRCSLSTGDAEGAQKRGETLLY